MFSMTCRHSTASCQLGFQPTTLKKRMAHYAQASRKSSTSDSAFGPRAQNMACVPSNSLVTSAVGLRANACVRPRSTTRDCPARGGDARNKQTKTSKLTHCAMYRCEQTAHDTVNPSSAQFPPAFSTNFAPPQEWPGYRRQCATSWVSSPRSSQGPQCKGRCSNEITRLWDPILFWIESA